MSCPEFIAQSLAVRTTAHTLHLTSTSYAQHVALEGFYTALVGLIDKYAEVYTGLEGRIPRYPVVKPPNDTDPIELLEDYLALIRDEVTEDEHASQALLNILAELEELTAQSLYKLKFLK